MKISPLHKRNLYFLTQSEQKKCLTLLREASKDNLSEKEDIGTRYQETDVILGQGSFGQVKVFFCLNTKTYVAVKIVRKSQTDIDEEIEQLNEYFVLKHLNNPYVIKVRELFETDTHYLIVMDFVDGSHLAEYLIKRRRNEEDTKQIVLKIFKGIHYLHSMGIAHRDIKLENIVVIFK